MKKVSLILVSILMMIAMTMTVYADSMAAFEMKISEENLYRGDEVTLTVDVSCSEQANSYGFSIEYDENIFELVEGSCTVTGTLVSSFNDGFAFLFQNPTAYSGAVGTMTLRVKEDAAFGETKLVGDAAIKNGTTAVAVTGCDASVTIVCNHSYGAWTEVEDGHSQTCSICGNVKTAEHTWDEGTTIKEANCKEGGQISYTCDMCSATKLQDTEKTEEHNYDNWITEGDSQHKHVCSVCAKEESANHAWDDGTQTKKPTCKEEGAKTFACTDCKATKTETLEKTEDHEFDDWTKVSDTEHKRICTICEKNEVGEHSYKTSWSKDRKNHWHECSVCKDQKDIAEHTPGPKATETRAQKCTVCGYVIKAALGHKHKYAAEWSDDDTGHWYDCSGCKEKGNYAVHDFENACDPDCSVCGATRDVAHTYEEEWATDTEKHWKICSGCGIEENKATHTYQESWQFDSQSHWHSCTVCGIKIDEANHEPGAEATATTAQTCNICNAELVPAIGEEETQPVATEPTELKEPTEETFPWWIVITAVVLVGGIVVMVIAIKKRK